MSNHTGFIKGYYSILQYVPDPERAEGVNVGIVLLCPERKFFQAKTSTDTQRVRRLIRNSVEFDLGRFDTLKEAFTERIASEAKQIRSLEDFQQFVATRANQFRLTAPRPTKFEMPEAELSRLFDSLVAEPSSEAERTTRATTVLKKQFRSLLKQSGLTQKVQEGVSVNLPFLGAAHYPFGYQNGQPNVIETVSFEAESERTIKDRTCRLIVESQELGKLPEHIKLNVLGYFKPEQAERAAQIQELLNENSVTLHTADNMEHLIAEIAATAH